MRMVKAKEIVEDREETEDPEFLAAEAAMLDEAIAEADRDPTRYTLDEVLAMLRAKSPL